LHPYLVGSQAVRVYRQPWGTFQRVSRLVVLVLLAALAASCGGSSGSTTQPATAPATKAPQATAKCGDSGTSLRDLIGVSGDQITTADVLVPGGRDFAAGAATRMGLGLLAKDGNPIAADNGRIAVYLAPDATSPAIGPFEAPFEKIEAPEVKLGASSFHGVYAAEVKVPQAGSYFVAACFTVGGKPSWGGSGVQILDQAQTLPVGADAPASDTPTIASTKGNLKALTTAPTPDPTLYRSSVAAALAAHAPFVVVFATPAFCESRLCGPVVDIVRAVKARMKDTEMRFIHVEIYRDNDPAKGQNRWVKQWHLPSEPWVFVVGRDGKIHAKFEGALGIDELEQAARAALPG
jgi:hypothetical protein